MTESGNAINVNACVPIAACQSQVKSSQVESRQVPIVFVSVFVFAMWAMAAAAGAAPAAPAATTH